MTHLKSSEFLSFHRATLTIVTQNDPEALQVAVPTAAYSVQIAEFETLFKINAFNPLTVEIKELDQQRDEIFKGIHNLLIANTSHFTPAVRDAAHLLQKDLKKYNSTVAIENYNSETTDLKNIINDWRNKTELQNAAALLGLLDWMTELERLNQLFNSKYIDRNSSYAAQTTENATSKRKQVTAVYDLLCQFLNSYAFLNDSPAYKTTISQINALIDQYSTMLKQRRAKSA
jgi:hypothetical protein